MAKKQPVWMSNKKGLKKVRCQADYVAFQGKRRFLLVSIDKAGISFIYNSAAAAKRDGWFK